MFDANEYALLDFGAGRKLERFGARLLDRPSPAAEGQQIAHPDWWHSASARFDLSEGGRGEWNTDTHTPQSSDEPADSAPWSVAHGDHRLVIQLNGSGNVGLFPEQASNWDWIAEQVKRCRASATTRRPRVLNLFAYTGGASLAAAAAGAEVTHVDSSAPTVSWAKRNAEASGMTDLPIRWLVEDAMKFVAREHRRGNTYDGVIADPPTYGHGPKGRPFKFSQHLDVLVEHCGELLGEVDSNRRFLLFSCHAPGFGTDDAVAAVQRVLPRASRSQVTGRPLDLETEDGRRLSAGVCARWSSDVV